jgi:hypothetical protein
MGPREEMWRKAKTNKVYLSLLGMAFIFPISVLKVLLYACKLRALVLLLKNV